MPLTEVQIKQAKPKEKRYMLRDDRGLYLEVQPNGNKHWRMRYWENGKEHKMSLGEYPLISLRQARDKLNELHTKRAQGLSLRATPQKARTFESVALEWHEKQILPKAKPYAEKVESILRRLVYPHIGNKDIRALAASDLLIPLRLIEARGIHDTAHTTLQVFGQIYRYAVASGYAERNPAADLQESLAPVVSKRRASLKAPSQIASLLRAMKDYDGSLVVKYALWLSAYTFLRPGEVRGLEWNEVSMETQEFRIPPERMKMERLHIVPLSRQVISIIEKLRPITGNVKYSTFASLKTS